MKIAYLLNSYPMTSTTFIRTEIDAVEEAGATILRYAIRRWSEPLVEPQDVAEQARTRYLLDHPISLLLGVAREAVANPRGFLHAVGLWRRLFSAAGEGLVRHAAYFAEAALAKRWAAADGVDHIHAHFSTNAAAVAMLARALGGPSYSFTAHGPDEFVDPKKNSLGLKVAHAAFVAAISHFARGQLALAAGFEHWSRIEILRCGVDLERFGPSDAPIDDDAPIVCVGRLCPQKGQSLIPAAVAELARQEPRLRLVLIGDGESRAAVEAAIAEHGLGDRIALLGWRDNEEVRGLVGRARALLLPSFAEGLPVVIMEAFALERPVISTFIAGIPELVDAECGWLTPAGDGAALAAAIGEAMAASPERLAAMGREGGERVRARHDQRANARALLALFQERGGALAGPLRQA